MKCPKCNNDITEEMLVCSNCKKILKLICPKCATINKSNVCKNCGFTIVSKCHKCGKVNQTIDGKCSKCGFSTYTSIAISTSNIDEFATLTIEFSNLSDIKSALGSTKLFDKFKTNLDRLITNYTGAVGLRREVIENVTVIRFNKDSSFKNSCLNALKASIEIQNLITELNFKLDKLKKTVLNCNIAVLKRDINSTPDLYKSGFDIRMVYDNKKNLRLINCLQVITDYPIYEQTCDDFELSSLSSSFVKKQMVMFFELNLKKYIKIPEIKEDEGDTSKLKELHLLDDEIIEREEEGDRLYNVNSIDFNELKCTFKSARTIDLVNETVDIFKSKRKSIVSLKCKKGLTPKTTDLLDELEKANIFNNIFRVTCYDEMKYKPYGFFNELISGIYNFAQTPKGFEINNFEIFRNIDTSGFIKDLINLNKREFPHPEDVRYSLLDIFFNIFQAMSGALIYIENIDKIDDTSFEILQLLFEKLHEFDVSYLVCSEDVFTLHKHSHRLLGEPDYTEITSKPTKVRNMLETNQKKYSQIIDSYCIKAIANNTKGSSLYFEHAFKYLIEKELLTSEKGVLHLQDSENIILPLTLEGLFTKRLKHLAKNKDAYKMFAMLLLIGPAVDLYTIKLLQIPNQIKIIQELGTKEYIYAYNNTVYILNYGMWRNALLEEIQETQRTEFAEELLQKVFSEKTKHPAESLIYKILKQNKNEFIVWENLSQLNASLGDFSAYLNCSIKFLKLLDNNVSQDSEKTIEEYKMNVYENISNLLYKYTPNEIRFFSKSILNNLEKVTDDEKLIKMCNKMLQGCLIGGNYSYALELAHKILSKFNNVSINHKDPNFDFSFFLISLVKIEILFSVGNFRDCAESGLEILRSINYESLPILKPENLSLKQFEDSIFDALVFVTISKILLLDNDVDEFIEEIKANLGKIPKVFELLPKLNLIIRGKKIKEDINTTVDDDKFSQIILNMLIAFNDYSCDYKKFADLIYHTKIMAKINRFFQIELFCDLLIGYSYFKLEQFKKAGSIYYNVLETSTQNGLKFITYLDWYFISVLKFKQESFDMALGIVNNAVVQLEKDNNSSVLLFFLFRVLLAKILMAKNDEKSSDLCIKNAVFIKEKYGLDIKIGETP